MLTHNKRIKPRKKKEKTDGDITFQCAKDCLHIHNHVMYNIQKVISGHKNYVKQKQYMCQMAISFTN